MRAKIELHNMDCMDALRQMEDNQFDLAIVDPPYGIGRSKGIGKRRNEVVFTKYEDKGWDKEPPSPEYWVELERVSINQIFWGANYFGRAFNRMIVWDKQIGDNDFSMAEVAGHTLNTPTKIVSLFCGANRNGAKTTRIHPTQKPVKLYKWILENYAKKGQTILDTHLGSGSIAIACWDLGFDLTGYELDKDYYKAALNRLEEHKKQGQFEFA